MKGAYNLYLKTARKTVLAYKTALHNNSKVRMAEEKEEIVELIQYYINPPTTHPCQ